MHKNRLFLGLWFACGLNRKQSKVLHAFAEVLLDSFGCFPKTGPLVGTLKKSVRMNPSPLHTLMRNLSLNNFLLAASCLAKL